jgi:hypothetical protein
MEYLNLIVAFIVIVVLPTFMLIAHKELKKLNLKIDNKDSSKNFELFAFILCLFEDKQINEKERRILYHAMFKTINDMESAGVIIPKEIKGLIEAQKEEINLKIQTPR